MDLYKIILNSVEQELRKCRATEQAQKIGDSAIATFWTDERGLERKTLSYSDGTSITFNSNNEIINISDEDGFNVNYKQIYKQFKNYGDDIIDYGSEEALDLYLNFTMYKQSDMGMVHNDYLRGIVSYDEMKQDMVAYAKSLFRNDEMSADEIVDYYLENEADFRELCKEMSLNGYGNFFTLRRQQNFHKNDDLNKRIISDKGYASSSVGISIDDIDNILALDKNDAWTIITKYGDDSKSSSGLYCGYAEYENNGHHIWFEIINAPNTKFKRTLIDYENRIIVQEPYEP